MERDVRRQRCLGVGRGGQDRVEGKKVEGESWREWVRRGKEGKGRRGKGRG